MTEIDKDDAKRLLGRLDSALPSINFVDTSNGWKLVVEAFGFREWFNVAYLNKVLSDSPYKLVKEYSKQPAATREQMDDPEGNSGRLYGKLFGIAHEDHNVLLSPSDVSVMERYIQKKSKNEEVIDVESTDPEGGPKRARYAWTGFPKSGSRYVNVDLFADVARGNCSPRVSSRIEEFVKKMFMGYNDSAVFEKLMILLAFAVGLGAVAFVWYVAQSVGGGGGGSPVPIFVGPGGLL